MEDIFTTKDLMELFNISHKTAVNWCKDGRFKNAAQKSRVWLVPKQDIIDYAKTQEGVYQKVIELLK